MGGILSALAAELSKLRTLPAAALAAELSKLRTLPAAALTAGGTVLLGGVIAAALAGLVADQDARASGAAVALQAVPYVQAGVILLGILPVSQEYAGRQIGTTLAAVPGRMRVIAAKTGAILLWLAVVAVVALAVAAGAAAAVLAGAGAHAPVVGEEIARLCGAAGYLVLIGLLAHAVALLVRQLTPALTAMLVLVFVLPPVLSALGEHARWLPDRAGAQLYAPGDAVLTAATGALVLAGWVLAAGVAGAARFARADA